MEAAQRGYRNVPCPFGVLLNSTPADLLHACADERRMEQPR